MAERKYAEGTTVTVAKSLGELSDLLSRHGVKERAVFEGESKIAIGFAHGGLQYRVEMAVPPLSDFERDRRNMRRDAKAQLALQEQEARRLMRALVLVVKAKLVAVQDGVSSFEREFLAHVVTDTGGTFAEFALPRLKAAAVAGRIPSSLPMPGEGSR